MSARTAPEALPLRAKTPDRPHTANYIIPSKTLTVERVGRTSGTVTLIRSDRECATARRRREGNAIGLGGPDIPHGLEK